MDGADVPIRFDVPAIIRKWPSLHNARRTDGTGPYLLIEGTLDECIREFMAKPNQPGICTKLRQRRSRR